MGAEKVIANLLRVAREDLDAAVAGFKVDLSKANAPAGSVTPLR